MADPMNNFMNMETQHTYTQCNPNKHKPNLKPKLKPKPKTKKFGIFTKNHFRDTPIPPNIIKTTKNINTNFNPNLKPKTKNLNFQEFLTKLSPFVYDSSLSPLIPSQRLFPILIHRGDNGYADFAPTTTTYA